MTPPRRALLGLATLALAVPAVAAPAASKPEEKRVAVRVVEVAGGRAFLAPGEEAGVVRGASVRFGRRRFSVIAVTATHAVIELGKASLQEGDRGVARGVVVAAAQDKLPAPAPLSHFAGQWLAPRHPAASQSPVHVPLGAASGWHPLRVTLVGSALALAPRDGVTPSTGDVELGGRLTWEPWRERPFGVDADAAALLWLGDDAAVVDGTRPPVRVRELRLRYGGARDPVAAAGRLRWAARTTGLLDGARVRTPSFGGFTAAAFGGFVPDLVTGAPGSDVARFGVEAWYAGRHVPAQPFASLTLTGSTFDGALDERRASVVASVAPGPATLDAAAEVAMFDAANPWGASRVELTFAAAGATVRAAGVHAGVHVDARQPERSRWLASLLPASWGCTAAPRPPGTPEPCDGDRNLRTSGTVDAGWTSHHLAASAGVSAVRAADTTLGAFASLRVFGLPGASHGSVQASASRGAFVDLAAVRVDAGAALRGGTVDLTVYWRGAQLDYLAAPRTFYEHRFGVDATLALAPAVDVAATAEAVTGDDLDAVMVLATATWRLLP